jgi:VanZ family protein
MGRQRLGSLWARFVLLAAVALMSAPIRPRGGPLLDSLTMIGGTLALGCLVAYAVFTSASAGDVAPHRERGRLNDSIAE